MIMAVRTIKYHILYNIIYIFILLIVHRYIILINIDIFVNIDMTCRNRETIAAGGGIKLHGSRV